MPLPALAVSTVGLLFVIVGVPLLPVARLIRRRVCRTRLPPMHLPGASRALQMHTGHDPAEVRVVSAAASNGVLGQHPRDRLEAARITFEQVVARFVARPQLRCNLESLKAAAAILHDEGLAHIEHCHGREPRAASAAGWPVEQLKHMEASNCNLAAAVSLI